MPAPSMPRASPPSAPPRRRAAQQLGLRADYVPTEAVAEAMLAQWPDADMTGSGCCCPALWKRAKFCRSSCATGRNRRCDSRLRNADGWQAASDRLRAVTKRRDRCLNLYRLVHRPQLRPGAWAKNNLPALVGKTTVAAIGPVTAETLREFGLNVDIVAEEHTIPGLVAALEQYFGKENTHD